MLQDVEKIKPTRRIFGILLLGLFLIMTDIFWKRGLIFLGILLIFLIPMAKSYVEISRNIFKKLKVNVSMFGNLEGKEINVVYRLYNPYYMPIFPLELSLKYPSYFKLIRGSPGGVHLILPKGYLEFKVTLLGRIGEHDIGPLDAIIRDPLGLFRLKTSLNIKSTIRIYPKVESIRVARLTVQARTVGLSRTKSKGSGIEFYDVREFQENDETRYIYWKALAKYGKLYVKEFEREITLNIMLILDTSKTMFIGNWGITPVEQGARTFASIAKYASMRDDKIGLTLFSERYMKTSPMRRGKVALIDIIRTLSSIKWNSSISGSYDRTSALTNAIKETAKNLSRDRNIIIFFTAPGDKEYINAVTKYMLELKSRGNDTYVILPLTVAYEVTTITGWQTIIYRLRSFDKLKNELLFSSILRSKGVPTIAVGPKDITQKIISSLEMIRASIG
ncbi:MAG: DUF58 domain-containing protein [Thermoprotei archaeon]